MSDLPLFQRNPQFNSQAKKKNWPTKVTIEVSDHAESIRLQFLEKSSQTREHPYYGLIFGTIMPFLCALFSAGNSQLRLEGAPQAELIARTTVSQEELDDMEDNEYKDFELDDPHRDTDNQPAPPSVPRELKNLKFSNMGQDWEMRSSKGNRATLKRVSRPPDSHTSDTSTSTVADNIPLRFIRITDGIFYARAREDAFNEARNAKDAFMPAVSVEVKVPPQCASKDEKTDTIEEIEKAKPQVIQHAQFIFHQWPTLHMIWTMTTCGKYAIFQRFLKRSTPEIAFAKIKGGQYYSGKKVRVKTLLAVEIMDEDGEYTEKFIKSWTTVMGDVENEYVRMMESGNLSSEED